MPYQGEKCPVSCWKGSAEDKKMAAAAQCKKMKAHAGWHQDKNGNNFDDNGVVVVIRAGAKKVPA